MIDKESVEHYLRVNGVKPSAPDNEIKEVLFSAKWHKEDIDTALMVLREDPHTHETSVDSLHKVFHSDDRLKPETISALLGIDVDIKPVGQRKKERQIAAGTILVMATVALGLSLAFVFSAMWYLKMGLFFEF